MEIVVISYLLMLNKFDINEKISLLLNIKSILLFSSNNCFLGIFPQTSAQKWLNTKYNIKIFFRFQQMYISKCKNNIIIFSYKFQMTKAAKKWKCNLVDFFFCLAIVCIYLWNVYPKKCRFFPDFLNNFVKKIHTHKKMSTLLRGASFRISWSNLDMSKYAIYLPI